MLIRIDDSAAAEILNPGPASDRILRSLENLLRAHEGRKHIISLSSRVLDALRPQAPQLSTSARAALSHILDKRQDIMGLERTLPYRVALGVGPAFDGQMLVEAGRHVIRADLLHFDEWERAARSVLVAENLTDAELYEILGKALVAAKGWQIRVSFELRGGGGNTIGAVFAQVLRDGRIALGLADSDRKYPPPAHQQQDPRAGLGDTAKALLDATPERGLQHAHVIHARDLENLVPFEVYGEALVDRRSPVAPDEVLALEALQRAAPQHRLPWRQYADLKSGLRLRDLRRLRAGEEERFWSGLAQAAGRDQCRDLQGCRAAGTCECYVVDGLGPKALERALAWVRTQRPERLARMLDFDHDPEMEALCAKIAAWGCALPQRIRA